jgi:hypothetical protein
MVVVETRYLGCPSHVQPVIELGRRGTDEPARKNEGVLDVEVISVYCRVVVRKKNQVSHCTSAAIRTYRQV